MVFGVEIRGVDYSGKEAGKRYRGGGKFSLLHCKVAYPCRSFVPT